MVSSYQLCRKHFGRQIQGWFSFRQNSSEIPDSALIPRRPSKKKAPHLQEEHRKLKTMSQSGLQRRAGKAPFTLGSLCLQSQKTQDTAFLMVFNFVTNSSCPRKFVIIKFLLFSTSFSCCYVYGLC